MKRLFCLFLTCLIGMSAMPAAVYAQQGTEPVTFSQQELDQLLAPIALYPDPLLSQILMAATYPLEAVQASRFVRQNPSLKGDALAQAVEGQPWDPSVKSLVQFPEVLAMMDDQLAWTQKLGDAFLAQQDAVMDTVQALRARAQAAGTLRSNQQQQVVLQDGAIDIEPYAADVIYVPYYNPTVIYGAWWWPGRPPMVWVPPPEYRSPSYGTAVAAGIAFGVGIGIIHSIFDDARPDWRRHHFVVRNGAGGNRAPVVWAHNPAHRLGVAYRDVTTRTRFQPSSNSVNRDAYRGHVNAATPQSITPSRDERIRSNSATSPIRHAAPQQIERSHPFMPAGSARVIQSNAERGRASRQGGASNPGSMRSSAPRPAAENRGGNNAQRGAGGHEQQHQPSR